MAPNVLTRVNLAAPQRVGALEIYPGSSKPVPSDSSDHSLVVGDCLRSNGPNRFPYAGCPLPTTPTQQAASDEQTDASNVFMLRNQVGAMEGHTPGGFKEWALDYSAGTI